MNRDQCFLDSSYYRISRFTLLCRIMGCNPWTLCLHICMSAFQSTCQIDTALQNARSFSITDYSKYSWKDHQGITQALFQQHRYEFVYKMQIYKENYIQSPSINCSALEQRFRKITIMA